MASQDNLVVVADGDILEDGYFNDINALQRILVKNSRNRHSEIVAGNLGSTNNQNILFDGFVAKTNSNDASLAYPNWGGNTGSCLLIPNVHDSGGSSGELDTTKWIASTGSPSTYYSNGFIFIAGSTNNSNDSGVSITYTSGLPLNTGNKDIYLGSFQIDYTAGLGENTSVARIYYGSGTQQTLLRSYGQADVGPFDVRIRLDHTIGSAFYFENESQVASAQITLPGSSAQLVFSFNIRDDQAGAATAFEMKFNNFTFIGSEDHPAGSPVFLVSSNNSNFTSGANFGFVPIATANQGGSPVFMASGVGNAFFQSTIGSAAANIPGLIQNVNFRNGSGRDPTIITNYLVDYGEI